MEIIRDKVDSGIQKYSWIMEHVHKVDVSTDLAFQKHFNGFYRMRQRPASFYKSFYAYLEANKANHSLTFENVLNYLYKETGSIHASFSSKLLATVNPSMPIWDKFVLKNLGLRTPYYYEEDRLQKTVQLYQKICSWYQSEDAVEKLRLFNELFPNTNIPNVKKVDFILWSTR